jgi:choline dehydrogenase-like flavoprotein
MSEPVIVVGSGPAGVSAAHPLLEAGVPVVMIDASLPTAVPSSPTGDIAGFRGRPDRWVTQFGADLACLNVTGDQSPKLATPFARAALAGYAEALGLSAARFLALGSMSSGGLSNIWGAAVAVYGDDELRGFPLSRADLMQSYTAVMRRIGTSGPGEQAGIAMPEGPQLTRPLKQLWEAAQRTAAPNGFVLSRAANAVLMDDRPARGACVRCGLCLWGCQRGSIYTSRHDLSALMAFPHFTYRPGVRARRLLPSSERPSIWVETDGGTAIMTGQRILLACGTIATTALVLRALNRDGPVRLLTNPVGAMAFVVPRLLGTEPPPQSFALAQLAFRAKSADGHEMAGMLYGADALPLAAIANRLPVSRPAALRLSRAMSSALVIASCYLPGRYSSNIMRLDGKGQDAPVVVEGGNQVDSDRAFRTVGRQLQSALRRLGAYRLPGSFSIALPGADAHYAGTLPMGGGGPTGTDLSGALRGLPGLHVVDGAALPDLPARHCTLTIMANADRVARRLLSENQIMK